MGQSSSTRRQGLPRLRRRDRLCPVCTEDGRKEVRLSGTLAQLQEFATPGCQNCWLVHAAVVSAYRSTGHLEGAPPASTKISLDATTGKLTIRDGPQPYNGPELDIERLWREDFRFELFTESGTQLCSLPYIPTRRDAAQVRKTAYIPLVKGWLRTCQQNHPECTKRRTKLPSRVIDVGYRPGEELSLYVTKRESAPYIALSHCWGGPELPKTTPENYPSRQKAILLKELPQSFQDAVHVTRGLGFRYLWIDSLCIIQGDKDDWEVESSRMAQVYNDAALVIGADQAKDSIQGFLVRQTDSPSSLPVATVQNKDGTWSNVHSRQFKQLHGDLCRVSPLATRGWTLQEQFLSRRMVHFVGRELIWECRTATWCECMEFDNMQKDGMNWLNRWYRPGETLGQKHLLESDLSKDKGLWHSMIQQYHARDLTHPLDFLPALSGIATYLQQKHSAEQYYAGLWGPSLGELLWYNDRGNGTGDARRAKPYRAPTWSWASVTADSGKLHIKFCADEHKFLTQETYIRDIACTPSGKDPNGAVTSGHITLQGQLFPAKLSYSDAYILQTDLGSNLQMLSIDEDLGGVTLDVDCILIGLHEKFISSGLILRKKPIAGNSTYERVGCFLSSAHGRDMQQKIQMQEYGGAEDDPTSITII